ncbi:MAG TPA: site-2 protease family protein [Terracidiphilus sp.]|jgi:Zn-dependent protease|nr:site-2 protease family protein [Terracidiphilus sp.]
MLRLGVPFRMHRTGWFLVVLCVVLGIRTGGWQLGFPLGALLLASLLIHEAGHMITARILRVPVREFGLKLSGTYVRRAQAHRRRDEILIAASGPLVNLLIVVPLLFVPRVGLQLAMCNLLLGVINLLPLPRSDGLRVLRNLSGAIVASDANPALTSLQPH